MANLKFCSIKWKNHKYLSRIIHHMVIWNDQTKTALDAFHFVFKGDSKWVGFSIIKSIFPLLKTEKLTIPLIALKKNFKIDLHTLKNEDKIFKRTFILRPLNLFIHVHHLKAEYMHEKKVLTYLHHQGWLID